MVNSERTPTELFSFIYALEDATYFKGKLSLEQKPNCHSFILIKDSSGQLIMDSQTHSLSSDTLFFIHADPHTQRLIYFQQPLEGYHVQFHTFTANSHGRHDPQPLPWLQGLSLPIHSELKVQEIVHQQTHDYMLANISFQTWIHATLHTPIVKQPLQMKQLLDQSRKYIETHYELDITREQLAQMTGLQVDYYSRKFKQLYQKSPIAYLNEVRLRQAKQFLIQTNEPIRSIAKKVGFRDEFYFSRKFKNKEGSSPSIYINKLREANRMASLNHLVTGHSMALGLEPYAALRNQSFPITYQLLNTISIGDHQPNLDKLVEVKPDFIVRCAPENQAHSTRDTLYQQIAPTLTLSYQDSWQEHLEIMARLLQKEREAAHFLETYHSKVESVQKRVRPHMGSSSILVIGIGELSLCIYGRRNLGNVLYTDLNISMPEGVEQIFHVKEISLHDVQKINPDHILLTVYRDKHRLPSQAVLQKQVKRLHQHPTWTSLKAVQKNRVYSILDTNHLYTSYNAYSNHLFLDKIKQLLGENMG